jgi:hypothetical protein
MKRLIFKNQKLRKNLNSLGTHVYKTCLHFPLVLDTFDRDEGWYNALTNRVYSSCIFTGYTRNVNKKFRISSKFFKMFYNGFLPIRRSSW